MSHQARNSCPACGHERTAPFFRMERVPVFCNVLHATAQAARVAPTGTIGLSLCPGCGLIWNSVFDPALVRYAAGYENSLSFSPTFQRYADELAATLVARHGLHGKTIVEIGCGDGAFLASLCEKGGNSGYGFDPSLASGAEIKAGAGVCIVPESFSGENARRACDLVCCRHVLEHIEEPLSFVRQLRDGIGDRAETRIFFEVPNGLWTIRDLGIWDVIYEHCSYFTPRSLSNLFARAAFDVTRVESVYMDQFLTIECLPAAAGRAATQERRADDVPGLAARYTQAFEQRVGEWRTKLATLAREGRRAALWGAGSKGVTFLNVLAAAIAPVACVVDVNPRKHDRFIAGVGRPIVPPAALPQAGVDAVIVMNPMYVDEIRATLSGLSVSAEVLVA